MGMEWLNAGSFVLGLVAWVLPVIALLRGKKGRAWPMLCAASLAACAVSLFLQLRYNSYLVYKNDWSALLDTSDALVRVAAVLLVITLVLNGVALIVCGRAKK